MRKFLIPIQGDYVAPRFDMASEIIVSHFRDSELLDDLRTIIMEKPSDENLCQMVVETHITDVICGGIDELHYKFLTWKRVNVVDSVVGSWHRAMHLLVEGRLKSRQIVLDENSTGLRL